VSSSSVAGVAKLLYSFEAHDAGAGGPGGKVQEMMLSVNVNVARNPDGDTRVRTG
jgi:hypothetical protein